MTELNLHGPGWPGTTAQDKRIIRGALAASVLLHVVLVAVTWRIPLRPRLEDLPVREPASEIELILTEESPEAAAERLAIQPDEPTTYVSIPERQAAEKAPDRPDYLALYHSVAADNKLGDSERPSADLEGTFDAVEIRREELDGAGGVQYSPQPQPQQRPAASPVKPGDEGVDDTPRTVDNQRPVGEWALPNETTEAGEKNPAETTEVTESTETVGPVTPELEKWWSGQSNPSILKAGETGAVGDRGFDFNQKATGAVTAGVAVIDQFQLNTVQWDWAPWIQVFSNELHRHWVAPPAYRLGLLTGTTVIRLVVEKNGRPSSMEILERDGHESLHGASAAALKAFAPYLPLPGHFPEENLVITLSLHYPAFRR